MQTEITSRARFDYIRYAQCWEDTDILLDALDIREGDTCLSIASAGDNSLALLAKNPRKVIAIDLSQTQLYCLQLRIAAYQHLTHPEFLELYGARPSRQRQELLKKCLFSLDKNAQNFWQMRIQDIKKYGFGGAGKFERYFRIFRQFILPLIHDKKTIAKLLQPKSLEQRQSFYTKQWDNWSWRLLLQFFFSKTVMGRMGRDPAFFKYVTTSVADHVISRVAHALQTLEPAENSYLQWILTESFQTALPFALRPENYEAIRKNLDRLEYRLQSIEDFTASGEMVDAFNLSNVFEYMSAESFSTVYTALLGCANSGACLAYWNMMVPRECPAHLQNQVAMKKEIAESLHAWDKAFFYSAFRLEQKK